MKIRDVLAQKGARVFTARPDKTIEQALALLSEHNISSLIVVNLHGDPEGIATERSILHLMAKRGRAAFSLPLTEAMQAPMPTCTPDMPVNEGLRKMTVDRNKHLAVLDEDGRLAGLVSIGDLVKAKLQDSELEGRVLRDLAYGHIVATSV